MNEEKIEAVFLRMLMKAFLRDHMHELHLSDLVLINKLMNQINKQNYNVSRKVLRSVQSKFEKIQDRYRYNER